MVEKSYRTICRSLYTQEQQSINLPSIPRLRQKQRRLDFGFMFSLIPTGTKQNVRTNLDGQLIHFRCFRLQLWDRLEILETVLLDQVLAP